MSSDGARGALEKLLATVAYGEWCEGEGEQRNGTTVAWAYMYKRAGGRHGRSAGRRAQQGHRLLVGGDHLVSLFGLVSHSLPCTLAAFDRAISSIPRL